MSANVNSTRWVEVVQAPAQLMSASRAVSALEAVMKNPSLVLSTGGAFSVANKRTGV